MNSGSSKDTSPRPRRPLVDLVADEGYPARASKVVGRIASATDAAEVHCLLREGVAALGAERGAFMTFEKDRAGLSSLRMMLDCPPQWSRRYLEQGGPAIDAWLAYAARESEPVIADALNIIDPAQRSIAALAVEAGFASTLLVPAHSGDSHPRVSLLCLGHSEPDYFESEGLPQVRFCARPLALEVHDWWLARIRRETLERTHITDRDLRLLEHFYLGHTSKMIGAEFNVGRKAVDSRFQRLLAKLGVTSRERAVRLVVDCGLIAR